VLRIALILIPFAAGIVTTVLLWGVKAQAMFFATAAETMALGAVAMALQGRLFRVAGSEGSHRPGGWTMVTILIAVGVGLGFAFAALIRKDGGADPHAAVTAGALAMGILAFAIQAIFGMPGEDEQSA
jgi:hypothetical protein